MSKVRMGRGGGGAPWKLVDKVVARRAARDSGDEAAKVADPSGPTANRRVGLLLLAATCGLGTAGRQAALDRRAEAAVPLCAHQPARASAEREAVRTRHRPMPSHPSAQAHPSLTLGTSAPQSMARRTCSLRGDLTVEPGDPWRHAGTHTSAASV